MSRSYKKTPIIKYAPTSRGRQVKWAKRQANKKVRKSDVEDGKAYRKYYCSYNIHDCIYYAEEEVRK